MNKVLFIALMGLGLQANASWYLVGEHFHTTTKTNFSRDPEHNPVNESYSLKGLEELIQRGLKQGLDAMIITDHNSMAVCLEPQFATSHIRLICGEEWTTKRSLHMGLFNPPLDVPEIAILPNAPGDSRDHDDVQTEAKALIERIHKTAEERKMISLVTINHPSIDTYRPNDTMKADAVEAMVPTYERPTAAREWWLQRTAAGRKITAVGGSDYHACQGWGCANPDAFRGVFDEPVNLVLASSSGRDDILQAIRDGHVVALSSAKHSDIRIDLSTFHNNHHYGIGDAIPDVGQGDRIAFRVGVHNAPNMTVRVFGIATDSAHAERILFESQITGDAWESTISLAKTRPYDALHVELYEPRASTPSAIANPIYF